MSEPLEDPRPKAARLPLDVSVAQGVVAAGLVIADRLLRGQASDERTTAFVSALRSLHLDVAGAQFDAALPSRPARNGEEKP